MGFSEITFDEKKKELRDEAIERIGPDNSIALDRQYIMLSALLTEALVPLRQLASDKFHIDLLASRSPEYSRFALKQYSGLDLPDNINVFEEVDADGFQLRLNIKYPGTPALTLKLGKDSKDYVILDKPDALPTLEQKRELFVAIEAAIKPYLEPQLSEKSQPGVKQLGVLKS